MRIVVAGGTGFIGRHVVDRLLEDGQDTVVVTSRDPERRVREFLRLDMYNSPRQPPLP